MRIAFPGGRLARTALRTAIATRSPFSRPSPLVCTEAAKLISPFRTHSTSSTSPSSATSSSVDDSEIAKFNRAASEWWNPRGEYELLHRMNPVRVRYVRDEVFRSNLLKSHSPNAPFTGLRILDIGCGGGLLSEALARLGATVIGADAGFENIAIAKLHAQQDPMLRDNPTYLHTTAEQLVADNEIFDIVCALEIIEHVTNPRQFTHLCSSLTKPGGLVFFSTINRTALSYFFTILLAENVLGWVPRGTHEHDKYITPGELEGWMAESGCESTGRARGLGYDVVGKRWRILDGGGFGDLEMNYIVAGRKTVEEEASGDVEADFKRSHEPAGPVPQQRTI
ncbi:S-adenosyl-L-methionine-dependent methyltransferase [Fimicolochytrium jonesii]|uniref:S-adenosyl-L-methionine-dependent methyltransferase n=1 Tax=Fimicolochytrium jonesii TaxID=1396493 RepID=UPI0022FE8F39|nr:S-adenosyl-L-methionine-dependent methyltransferase [Fimicolochytrium jonesii]KAI8820752.1 S-adenosyl-L-methionine-dependent methyltransferase [Fimicolochytrium jonesii]